MSQSDENKPVSQMDDEEKVRFVKNRFGTALKNSIGALVGFLILFGIYTVGKNIINPYPEVTSINTLYNMESPSPVVYITQNIGEKIQYSDLFIWQVDTDNGIVSDIATDVYFRNKDDVSQISPGSIISIKGTIGGLSNDRLIISDARLVDVDNSQINQSDNNFDPGNQPEEFDNSNTNVLPDNYYDISISGNQLIEEAHSNMARVINTYAGKRVMISDLEIVSIYSDCAYFDLATPLYFQNENDLYSVSEGERITVIGSISEKFGSYCIENATLVEMPSAASSEGASTEPIDVNNFSTFEGEYHMAHNYTIQMNLWFNSDMSGVNSSNWQGSEPLELQFIFTDTYANEILGDGIAYWWPLSDGLPYFEGELYSSLEPITLEYDGYNFIVNCSALELQEASFFKD